MAKVSINIAIDEIIKKKAQILLAGEEGPRSGEGVSQMSVPGFRGAFPEKNKPQRPLFTGEEGHEVAKG